MKRKRLDLGTPSADITSTHKQTGKYKQTKGIKIEPRLDKEIKNIITFFVTYLNSNVFMYFIIQKTYENFISICSNESISL